MAAGRTGTGHWKRLRAKVLAEAQANGLTRCPLCGISLDWDHALRPNSPEADHVLPHSKGGRDEASNLRAICRRCNQSLGGKVGNPKGVRRPKRIDFGTASRW